MNITGSLVALVTPMKEGGEVDFTALKRLVEWHISSGTSAIVSVGTTGESATLSQAENVEVVGKTIEYVNGRIPVIAGTGANSTAEAIEMTLAAAKLGADASLQVVPYYNKPEQAGMYAHFKLIAETVSVPHILYNVPGRTVVDMSNETTLRLAEIDNIVGIKDASGNVARGAQLIADAPDDFSVYSGDDATALELIMAGAKGDVSVTANVAPAMMSAMVAAALNDDIEAAKAYNLDLMGLHTGLFVEASPAPCKWALHQMGKLDNVLRLPLLPLSRDGEDVVAQAMSQAGIEYK
ncbi:MAG: 4-hydroxy-tetrahydrodipicolinate synthase [Proteobacteria bacterium]|jgi:4-hydroxy-tetrahydrodipicolinate synthase|nr:4-hydroxy-tetrahydrodipicolinate synthase [Pseudomonadota bacterium]